MSGKRLFIFAAYDKQGVIDDALLHYIKSLSYLGDIIFVMDNELVEKEAEKLKKIPNILNINISRHEEYDFGSYKRGYQYAYEKGILSKYDWVYFVNDSVYGPLFDLGSILTDLESRKVDLIGLIDFCNDPTPPQVQSWFVGISKEVASSDFIKKFLYDVRKQSDKQLIVLKYEVGFSRIILQHGYKMSTLIRGEYGEKCHTIYEKPISILKQGVPFIKKSGLKNLSGLQYLYPYTTDSIVDKIYKSATRTGVPFIKEEVPPKYEKLFRLTVLSVPIFTLYCQIQNKRTLCSYKGYLFDYLPVFKVSIHK